MRKYVVLVCTVCEGEGATGLGDFRSGRYPASKLQPGETVSACQNCGGAGTFRVEVTREGTNVHQRSHDSSVDLVP